MRVVTMTTPPSQGIAPPERPVPAPRAVTGTPWLPRDANGGGDTLGGLGEHDGFRQAALDGGVVLVDEEVLGRRQYPTPADCGLEFANQGTCGGHAVESSRRKQ